MGARADGHDYAAAAFDRGARCALAERALDASKNPYILVDSTRAALQRIGAYYRGLFDIPVVGVTGSVGKTTAKEMLAAVLGERYNVLKTPENLNNELGVPLTLLSMRAEHTAAVIEMGVSDFGEMSRLAEMVRPTVCLMTAIGYCHLDALGDLDGVLRAKSEVFAYMPPDSVAVVNGDDALLRTFDPGIAKITFGLGAQNAYRAENVVTHGTRGVTCELVTPAERLPVEIPAFGSHMVLAALPAAAIGRLLGVTAAEIARGLLTYTPAAGRANVIDTGYITVIDDCYNANPNSVKASLRSLCALPRRRVAILGVMAELGKNSDALHREIGVFAAESGVDCLICLGEKAEFIYKGSVSSQIELEGYHFPFKDAFFERLPSLIKPGDAVLVKASHSMKFEEIADRLIALGKSSE
jgi:UDP-N-acetylmuramoyl-tripeptide--D-alanyl-D-alanine ligase